MDVQALGVELLQDIRCVGCGKVLAGRIESEYERLTVDMLREMNNSLPPNLHPQERDELAVRFMSERNKEIFKKLGIKRGCCMNNLQYKSQLLVGAPSPVGNTIIDRQNMADFGFKRSITRIELSTKSRVPGNSSMNMMSFPGEGDHSPEWNKFQEKMRKELSKPELDYASTPTKLISYKSSFPLGFNIKSTSVPIVNSGNSKSIDSSFLDMLQAPVFTGGFLDERIEIETIHSFTDLSISREDAQIDIDGNNYRDLMDYEITAPGQVDDLNNRLF